MRSFDSLLPAIELDLHCDFVFIAGELQRFGVEQNVDSIFAKNFCNLAGHVRIFVGQQLVAGLDDGDAAAKASKHLAEFHADISAAKDQQMLGKRSSSMMEALSRMFGSERIASNPAMEGGVVRAPVSMSFRRR